MIIKQDQLRGLFGCEIWSKPFPFGWCNQTHRTRFRRRICADDDWPGGPRREKSDQTPKGGPSSSEMVKASRERCMTLAHIGPRAARGGGLVCQGASRGGVRAAGCGAGCWVDRLPSPEGCLTLNCPRIPLSLQTILFFSPPTLSLNLHPSSSTIHHRHPLPSA